IRYITFGFARRNSSTSPGATYRQRSGVRAITSATTGSSRSAEISPKKLPAVSAASSSPSRTTETSPSTMIKRPGSICPRRTTHEPSPNDASSTSGRSSSSSACERSRNRASRDTLSTRAMSTLTAATLTPRGGEGKGDGGYGIHSGMSDNEPRLAVGRRHVPGTNGGEMVAVPEVEAGVLTQEELQKIDKYWRAANYLAVGQIYLLDNALLKEPLAVEHVKPRLLGHWGTTPGLNFIYVHLN